MVNKKNKDVNGATEKKKRKPPRERRVHSDMAGLILPISRVKKILKNGRFAKRISVGAAVYLTAALEYLSSEILDLSVSAARHNNRSRIIPKHLVLAIRQDDDFKIFLQHVVISQGGVLPRIEPELLPKKAKKNEEAAVAAASQEY